uniref:PsbP C-terminal domain-containing protein n=1 Tax=Lotharella oceanica TaxID=641309 RepID=A0A7S2XH31_9EUKA|mmetsp:Transcript_8430/g.16541  ORF Transcript_8430/g.16541 Transcript_8430/m.16541 type:complete len:308 (+) Transcript_8430:8-931(+)
MTTWLAALGGLLFAAACLLAARDVPSRGGLRLSITKSTQSLVNVVPCVRRGVPTHAHPDDRSERGMSVPRRGFLNAVSSVTALRILGNPLAAHAFEKLPQGYAKVQSKLDGYKFYVPDFWLLSKTSGNDAAYENPLDFQQNLFVSISGATRFSSITDVGSPEEVARDIEKKILKEFMSTRIGVRRDSQIVSATPRQGKDGSVYYDVQVRVKSFASRNQLAVTAEEMEKGMEQEFDRTYVTSIGVANNRVYDLRLQTGTDALQSSKGTFDTIMASFEVSEVKCPTMDSCKANGAKIVKKLPEKNPSAF